MGDTGEHYKRELRTVRSLIRAEATHAHRHDAAQRALHTVERIAIEVGPEADLELQDLPSASRAEAERLLHS